MNEIAQEKMLVSFQLFVVILACLLICNSEKFQEFVSPKVFWKKKVRFLESNRKLNLWKIQVLQLSLEKEKQIAEFDIKAAVYRAKTFDEDISKVTFLAEEQLHEKIVFLNENIEMSKKTLDFTEQQLKIAQEKLKEMTHS